jgi:hypothetical protein
MQQRYYDPVASRFLSVDPVTTDASSGSHFNRYVYGNNNPYKYTDPDGRISVSFESVFGFGGGITVGYNMATTEFAITLNAGAGVSGGAQLDLRPNENGRASPADNRVPSTAGVAVNSYGKVGGEVNTPVGTAAVGAKVTAGKDLSNGGIVGGLSPEAGLSGSKEGIGAKAGISGGVEVSAYVNVKGAISAAGSAVNSAVSKAATAFFNTNAGKQISNAMQPQTDPQR